MIKVGVVGVGRGRTFINSAKDTGMELVALCDIWEEKLNEIGKQYNVATYTDFDKFLEHDMDAVILDKAYAFLGCTESTGNFPPTYRSFSFLLPC
jgi:predicted dinucleotide-utilizing enzyme